MRVSRIIIAGYVFLLAMLGLMGCASSEITLYVTSEPKTNEGRPLYVILRSVDNADFVTDTYEATADRLFATPADETVLRADVVYPGVEAEISVEKPEKKPLAIYFLFTKPGERWKTSIRQPCPDGYEIRLGENQIADYREL